MPALQIAEQVNHLGAHRYVERAHRLIERQELRLQRQRTGNVDALPLTAAELMRVAVQYIRIQADLLHQLHHACARLIPRVSPMDGKRLTHDGADAHRRIQCCKGILKDHLHPSPQRPQPRLRGRQHIYTVEVNLAGGWLDEPQQHPCHCAFAGARFADKPQRLPAPNRERNIAHHLARSIALREPFGHHQRRHQASGGCSF